jgi:hypothetical protein
VGSGLGLKRYVTTLSRMSSIRALSALSTHKRPIWHTYNSTAQLLKLAETRPVSPSLGCFLPHSMLHALAMPRLPTIVVPLVARPSVFTGGFGAVRGRRSFSEAGSPVPSAGGLGPPSGSSGGGSLGRLPVAERARNLLHLRKSGTFSTTSLRDAQELPLFASLMPCMHMVQLAAKLPQIYWMIGDSRLLLCAVRKLMPSTLPTGPRHLSLYACQGLRCVLSDAHLGVSAHPQGHQSRGATTSAC